MSQLSSPHRAMRARHGVRMKTLKTFSNLAEAGFAQSLLEAAGLHPFLADEQIGGGYTPIAVGMRLQVEESEYEHALRVLAEGLDAEPTASEAGPSPMAGLAADPRASGRMPIGIFVAVAVGFVVIYIAIGDKLPRSKRRASQQSQASYTNAAGEQVYPRDSNKDGKADEYWYYRDGKYVRYEADRNFDGRIDTWDYYGSDGTTERSESDENFDGKPDRFTTYRKGRVTKIEQDQNFDGKIDESFFYNSRGAIERSEIDENYDGILDHWYDYRDGLSAASRMDTDLNGIPDFFLTYRDGVRIQCDIRPNDSPVVTRRQFYKNGLFREEWVDEDADGKFDYRIEYDPFGKPSGHLPMAESK